MAAGAGENLPGFRSIQLDFAAYMRDPERQPAPAGIELRRLAVYAELIHDNIRGFLDRTFPVARSMLGEASWSRLGRAFIRDHRADTPYFTEIPLEFLAFLAGDAESVRSLPEWLPSLCHYEWLELELDIAPDPPMATDPQTGELTDVGDPLAAVLAISPLARPVRYDWPVHRLGPQQPVPERGAAAVNLVVYRDPHDEVRFMELNPVAALLLSCFEAPTPAVDALARIAESLDRAPLDLADPMRDQLRGWLDRGVVVVRPG